MSLITSKWKKKTKNSWPKQSKTWTLKWSKMLSKNKLLLQQKHSKNIFRRNMVLRRKNNFLLMKIVMCICHSPLDKSHNSQLLDHCNSQSLSHSIQRSSIQEYVWLWRTQKQISERRLKNWTFHALQKLLGLIDLRETSINSKTRGNCREISISSWLILEFTRCFQKCLAKNFTARKLSHAQSKFTVLRHQNNCKNNWTMQVNADTLFLETDQIIVLKLAK